MSYGTRFNTNLVRRISVAKQRSDRHRLCCLMGHAVHVDRVTDERLQLHAIERLLNGEGIDGSCHLDCLLVPHDRCVRLVGASIGLGTSERLVIGHEAVVRLIRLAAPEVLVSLLEIWRTLTERDRSLPVGTVLTNDGILIRQTQRLGLRKVSGRAATIRRQEETTGLLVTGQST